MKIAFYAPMKPADHTVASGDREIARLFIRAIETAGHSVSVASRIRGWEGEGNAVLQNEIKQACDADIQRLLDLYKDARQKPDLWFTYHAYHKAPDWLGPCISKALKIPYVIAEASIAGKQKQGPWQQGYEQTLLSVQMADSIISLNRKDLSGLSRFVQPSTQLIYIAPFLDTNKFESKDESANDRNGIAKTLNISPEKCWLTVAAMMRPGDKTQSYKVLANTLGQLKTNNWHLIVIGGGEQATSIKKLFCAFNKQITFTGILDQPDVRKLFALSDIFIWPAINEAFGMALLEAQAAGLPAVVGNFGDVSAIVNDHKTGFVITHNKARSAANNELAIGLAEKLDLLIENESLRNCFSNAAMVKIQSSHSLETVGNKLDSLFKELLSKS